MTKISIEINKHTFDRLTTTIKRLGVTYGQFDNDDNMMNFLMDKIGLDD